MVRIAGCGRAASAGPMRLAVASTFSYILTRSTIKQPCVVYFAVSLRCGSSAACAGSPGSLTTRAPASPGCTTTRHGTLAHDPLLFTLCRALREVCVHSAAWVARVAGSAAPSRHSNDSAPGHSRGCRDALKRRTPCLERQA